MYWRKDAFGEVVFLKMQKKNIHKSQGFMNLIHKHKEKKEKERV